LKLSRGISNLKGSIPSEIGNLTNLEELILHQQLQSPDSILSEIVKLTKLKKLDLILNNQKLTEIPPEIGNLINLEEF